VTEPYPATDSSRTTAATPKATQISRREAGPAGCRSTEAAAVAKATEAAAAATEAAVAKATEAAALATEK
jgi:hypothetical protein